MFVVFLVFFIVLGALLGWVPGFIAYQRGHRNAQAILVCGILGAVFGGFFWLGALVWSLTDDIDPRQAKSHNRSRRGRRRRRRPQNLERDDAADALEHLND